jgi:hypothetical protein
LSPSPPVQPSSTRMCRETQTSIGSLQMLTSEETYSSPRYSRMITENMFEKEDVSMHSANPTYSDIYHNSPSSGFQYSYPQTRSTSTSFSTKPLENEEKGRVHNDYDVYVDNSERGLFIETERRLSSVAPPPSPASSRDSSNSLRSLWTRLFSRETEPVSLQYSRPLVIERKADEAHRRSKTAMF